MGAFEKGMKEAVDFLQSHENFMEFNRQKEQCGYDIEVYTHRSKDPNMDTAMDAKYHLAYAKGFLSVLTDLDRMKATAKKEGVRT